MTQPHRYRAPRADGGILADPPFAQVGSVIETNRRLFSSHERLCGLPWSELRRRARQQVIAEATNYLRALGEPVPNGNPDSLVLSGHQPELPHPGVWVKNFALHRLAQQHDATPLQLIIDTDELKSSGLLFPSSVAEQSARPHPVLVAFDVANSAQPYEERLIHDWELFRTFAERARPLWSDWGFEPLLPRFWDEVVQRGHQHRLLGELFAATRRQWERRWGCQNFELPMSRLCRTEVFARFVCDLLAALPRFHAVYNDSIRAYRRRHGLRSRTHPVPELVVDGDWLEAPFWIWRTGQRRRGRLFVRHHQDQLQLRATDEVVTIRRDSLSGAVSDFLVLLTQGLKIHTRALTTTLFCRLLLADLFIHGIGGGTYDELTDELIRRFYQLEPPTFQVVSATLLLPLPALPATVATYRRLQRDLRALWWNPQRYLKEAGALQDVVVEKQRLIQEQPTNGLRRRQRYRELRALTERIRPTVAEQEACLHAQLAQCEHELPINAVRQRRDYSFCLYPETMLREFFDRVIR